MYANRTCQLRSGLWSGATAAVPSGPDPTIMHTHIRHTSDMQNAQFTLITFYLQPSPGESCLPLPGESCLFFTLFMFCLQPSPSGCLLLHGE